MNEAVRERFMEKVRIDASGCWVWTAATDGDGYGVFYLRGKNPRAHRVSLMLRGIELPDGMVVDHVCRNRACVNPEHLRVVDRRTNVHENSEAPAKLNALKTHCPQGHAYADGNLISESRGKRGCRACKAAWLRQYRARSNPKGDSPVGNADAPKQESSPSSPAAVREAFEAAISASPYERSVSRYPDDATRSAWPGNYRDIAVDLAWRMWQEAWRLSTVPAQEPLSDSEIEALAHRMAWRYKHSSDHSRSDTYTFNRQCLLAFVRALGIGSQE
jgi:hypothetical protein